jgi:hypothetical protein
VQYKSRPYHKFNNRSSFGVDRIQNNVPEDPLMRTMIVPEDVGDTANEFKFKGNGNHYEQ